VEPRLRVLDSASSGAFGDTDGDEVMSGLVALEIYLIQKVGAARRVACRSIGRLATHLKAICTEAFSPRVGSRFRYNSYRSAQIPSHGYVLVCG
jgi:hypothetical protein